MGTGYGTQTAEWVPRLAALGHEIVISAYYGIDGGTTNWNGHLVLPKGQDPYGSDIIVAHMERTRADALITLMDAWVLDKAQIREIRERLRAPVFHWLPVDTATLSAADRAHLVESGARPVAMSRHGLRELNKAGFGSALYTPHGLDMTVFKPPADRDALRRAHNFEGRFTVGICAANKDQFRKGMGEAFEVFRQFSEECPEADALLSVHSLVSMPTGLNLNDLGRARGISARLAFNDQYAMTIGAISQEALATWLGSLDLLINIAYGGGFELTPLEAMGCGTPAIVNDCSAMSELGVPGWRVKGQPFYNGHHQADWQVPFIKEAVRYMKQAYAEYQSGANHTRREKARQFALRYDAERVLSRHWKPVMRELEAERGRMLRIGADRDAAVARLSAAWSDGRLDAEAFGDRARHALSAASADDLIPLVADLPEAA